MAKATQTILSFIVLGCVALFVQQQTLPSNTKPGITMLDIGQGDSIYIRTEMQQDVLIDGGPDNTVLERLPEVMEPGDTTIELVMLSHPDADHIKGLLGVMQHYTVKQIVTSHLTATKPQHLQLIDLIQQQGTVHTMVQFGDVITLNDQESFTVLSPFPDQALESIETNDTSVVALYTHQGIKPTTMLFTGDIGTEAEELIVSRNVLADIDILKVGHHGSKSSSIQEFVDAATPETCLISVAAGNRYGHPTQEAMQRLQWHCTIYRTDELGNIRIKWNEQGYVVE